METSQNIYKILVCSGGGSKGLLYLGILQALNDIGILHNIELMCGTSIGGICLALYFLDVGFADIVKIICSFERFFTADELINSVLHQRKSIIKNILTTLFETNGIDTNMTLNEFTIKINKIFIVTSFDLNSMKNIYISHKNFPTMTLLDALTATSNVPIFPTLQYNNYAFVDGAISNNFPYYTFRNIYGNCVLGLTFNVYPECEGYNKLKKLLCATERVSDEYRNNKNIWVYNTNIKSSDFITNRMLFDTAIDHIYNAYSKTYEFYAHVVPDN